MSRAVRRAGAAGFTLVELLVAMGLLAILMAAVVRVLDGSLRLWDRTETRRELVDEAGGVLELLARDLRQAAGGPRGDFLAQWVAFDTTGDGSKDSLFPRLSLVRHASRGELARLYAGLPPGTRPPRDEGLLEVVWALAPAAEPAELASDPDLRAEAVAWRGERVRGADGVSVFERGFYRSDGRPVAGGVEEVTGGVLWLGLGFASQTTVLTRGWSFGSELGQAGTSWDAWSRARPDETLTDRNAPVAGVPAPRAGAVLPRRVRLEVEIERARDRRRRTRLSAELNVTDARLPVDDAGRLPRPGAFVKVGPEWMELVSKDEGGAAVRRGARGTLAVAHGKGELVHWGLRLVRDVPIPESREDWGL